MIKLKLGIDQESNMATGVHNHSTKNIISNKNRKANKNQRKKSRYNWVIKSEKIKVGTTQIT